MPSSPACRPTPGVPRPVPRAREGNRGTTLQPARPAHTPGTGSSDKPLPGPVTTLRPRPATQRPSLPLPKAEPAIPRSLPPAVGDAAGPGGAPAAQQGRTTWRCGKTTATLGREEGQGPRIAGKAAAPEGHLTRREKDWRSPLTQRGFRYARQVDRRPERVDAPRTGRSVRADAGGDDVPDRAPLRESSPGGVYGTLLARAWPGICKIPVEGSISGTCRRRTGGCPATACSFCAAR